MVLGHLREAGAGTEQTLVWSYRKRFVDFVVTYVRREAHVSRLLAEELMYTGGRVQSGGDGDDNGDGGRAGCTLRLRGRVWSRVWLQAAPSDRVRICAAPEYCLSPSLTSLG